MTNLLPPFGDEVSQVLKNRKALRRFSGCTEERATIWILTGEGAVQKHGEMRNHLTVILPTEVQPGAFYWGFIAGHEPALVWCDPFDWRLIERLWAALERDGVASALFGNGDGPDTHKKKTEVRNAIRSTG